MGKETKQRYRATVRRATGVEEDWGFYSVGVHDSGALVFRTLEATPDGRWDAFIGPGTWTDVYELMEEDF